MNIFLDSPKVSSAHHIVNTISGNDAELHCHFNSTTDASVTWRKENELVDIDDRKKYDVSTASKLTHHTKSTLVIKNVQDSDLGVYQCEVQNSIGIGHSRLHLVYVPEPPRFISYDTQDDTVITHWHINSFQPLTEVMLNYKKNGVRK